jgi:predicted transcriptional regulator
MGRTAPKEEVRRLLDALPDEADIQQKIARGLEAAERGDFISDEEIEERIARWTGE